MTAYNRVEAGAGTTLNSCAEQWVRSDRRDKAQCCLHRNAQSGHQVASPPSEAATSTGAGFGGELATTVGWSSLLWLSMVWSEFRL